MIVMESGPLSPGPLSHLTPRERVQALHLLSLEQADRSHLEPMPLSSRYSSVHQAVKAFYLRQGHSESDWSVITSNPKKFNSVWCSMLGIKQVNNPPPVSMRFVLPSFNPSFKEQKP